MRVIKPTQFVNSMLVSTTATDSTPAWSSATTYALNSVVQYQNKIYKSVSTTGNTNQIPSTAIAHWVLVGPNNPYAMFDRTVSYGTTAVTSITVVIAPGRINSLALINVVADTVEVTIRDGIAGAIIFQETQGLNNVTINDWYDYFFIDPLRKRTQMFFKDIPEYASAHITLKLTSATSQPVSLGEFIFGSLSVIGATQYGATAGIIDYSRKETDDFGNVTFVERPFSKRISAEVHLPNSQLNRVQQLMYGLRATPAVWIGSLDTYYEESLIVYGFYRDFSTNISYPSHSVMQLEIEGLA